MIIFLRHIYTDNDLEPCLNFPSSAYAFLRYSLLDRKTETMINKKIVEMIPVKKITTVTGYVRWMQSSGNEKQFPPVIPQSALEHENILFSAGRLGAQLEMEPRYLTDLIGAHFADIITG